MDSNKEIDKKPNDSFLELIEAENKLLTNKVMRDFNINDIV